MPNIFEVTNCDLKDLTLFQPQLKHEICRKTTKMRGAVRTPRPPAYAGAGWTKRARLPYLPRSQPNTTTLTGDLQLRPKRLFEQCRREHFRLRTRRDDLALA